MPFIDDILDYSSLSIVGMEKNSGKTECLNYILRRLPSDGLKLAVSSIGTDGERVDSVTSTSKPEIVLKEGTYFATTERYYVERGVVAELLDISSDATAMGRVVTAVTLSAGKVILSGPPSTPALKRWMDGLAKYGVGLTIIDGALSRLSLASPAVSQAMVLSTGAALSADMDTLVRETAFTVGLINIPLVEERVGGKLRGIEQGLWTVGRDGELRDLGVRSSLSTEDLEVGFMQGADVLYVSGALTERLLEAVNRETKEVEIVVTDFTKIFVSSRVYNAFRKRGGRISVLDRSHLIAVCVNPTAPSGFTMDSEELCQALSRAISLPVYDLMKRI